MDAEKFGIKGDMRTILICKKISWNAVLIALPGILFWSEILLACHKGGPMGFADNDPGAFLWMFHHPLLSLQPALSAQLAVKTGITHFSSSCIIFKISGLLLVKMLREEVEKI